MTIKIYPDLIQGSDEWKDARRGLLTASEMKLVITPKKLEIANNDKTKTHLFELLAQRITGYTEPSYIGDNILRGWEDEITARMLYSEKYALVEEVGFVTNQISGITLGCSPDGLVGTTGMIECKSRKQAFQAQAIANNEVHEDFILQIQTGLLVTGREWCDFISYSGGMPMFVKRVEADTHIQGKILEAALFFEKTLAEALERYKANSVGLHPTERREIEQEITVG